MKHATNLPRSADAYIDADYFNSLRLSMHNASVTPNTSALYFNWCMHSRLFKGFTKAVMYIKRLFVKK